MTTLESSVAEWRLVARAGEGKSSSVLDRLWWRCLADYQTGCQIPTYIVKSGACGEVRARDTF